MFRLKPRLLWCLLPLTVFISACNKDTATSPTTTTTTTTTTTSTTVSTTDTFSDVLVAGGAMYHTFHTQPGTVTTTLVSVDPSTFTPGIGLGIGMWDGNACTLVLANASATPGSSLVGTATVETDLCVKVYDPGTFDPSFSLTYQVTATHLTKSQ